MFKLYILAISKYVSAKISVGKCSKYEVYPQGSENEVIISVIRIRVVVILYCYLQPWTFTGNDR